MTTIFGIRHPAVDLALLVADRQTTTTYANGSRPEKFLEGRKLWVSQNELYSFGHSGMRDNNLQTLANEMVSGKIDLEKVLAEKKFTQLRELNLSRLGDKLVEEKNQSSFLITSRNGGTTKLYTCWPLGLVEEREWTQIGSGSARIEEYMKSLFVASEARSYLGNNSSINSDDITRVGLEALRYAQGKDIYSSGLDMVVLTPNKTLDCFNDLQEDFKAKIEGIQKKVSGTFGGN